MPKTDTPSRMTHPGNPPRNTDKQMARELREEAARLEKQGKALLKAADALEGKV